MSTAENHRTRSHRSSIRSRRFSAGGRKPVITASPVRSPFAGLSRKVFGRSLHNGRETAAVPTEAYTD